MPRGLPGDRHRGGVALSGRIFLANVGANASHPFRSPIFADGTFEVLPIPEEGNLPGDSLVRFGELRSFNDPQASLRCYVPQRWWDYPCHFDPEFDTFTYGDNCATAPRAAALKSVLPGDFIFFIVRLVSLGDGEPGFYLMGYLEVESALASVTGPPGETDMAWAGNNAHIRRALSDPEWWNGFCVFRGSANSRRFRRAVPVSRELASRVFRTAAGRPWRWDSRRSDLQVIGSYTRSCRCVIDPGEPGGPERAARFWDAIAQVEGAAGLPPSVALTRRERPAELPLPRRRGVASEGG